MSAHWIVEIDEKGNVEVEGHGFKGKACDLPADVLDSLGGKPKVRRKAEYYQRDERRIQGKA